MTQGDSRQQQASGTALATAFMRALAAGDPREALRGPDTLAELFLPEDQKRPLQDAAARAWVMQNRLAPGAYEFMLARTAFFDEIVEQALMEDIPQLVLLGAGYDSRPYRFRQLIRNTTIFELDTFPTLERKQDCLHKANVPISAHIRFVPLDLGSADLMSELTAAGFRRDQRTLFVWEGVTYYLDAKFVDDVLETVRANTPARSSICFDYAALSEQALGERGAQALRQHMRSEYAAEPTRFGIPAGTIEDFLGARGYAVNMQLTAADMQAKYLPGIPAGEGNPIPGLFCLVCAVAK